MYCGDNMKRFKMFAPPWWILHVLMLVFFVWLGHVVRF
jgi:hypothetical protein